MSFMTTSELEASATTLWHLQPTRMDRISTDRVMSRYRTPMWTTTTIGECTMGTCAGVCALTWGTG
jgi:hypothetical protein